MARIRRLVSLSCHLIPSVRLSGPLSLLLYLSRSANHISVIRVTCFPVLQSFATSARCSATDISTRTYTSSRFRLLRIHRSSCAHGSFDLLRSPNSPTYSWPGEFETSRARLYLFAQPRRRLTS